MKVSELIKELNNVLDEDGDYDLYDDGGSELVGISFNHDDKTEDPFIELEFS